MVFYTPFSEPRPTRLCEETRLFAWESMHGKYGDEARRYHAVSVDHIPGFSSFPRLSKCNICMRRNRQKRHVSIAESGRFAVRQTLGSAIDHVVPAFYKGAPVFSHV
jgi:hypothetical protein